MPERISSANLNQRGIDAILDKQRELSNTQLKVSTGKRILTPKDDPIGSARLLNLKSQRADIEQFQDNVQTANRRLETSETVLKSVNDLYIRFRELAISANSSAKSDKEKNTIAIEMRTLQQQLISLANTQDNGEYIFSGYKGLVAPVESLANGTFQYNGDEGTTFLKIGTSRNIQTTDNGKRLFFDIDANDLTLIGYTGETAITSAVTALSDVGSVDSLTATGDIIINSIYEIQPAATDGVSTADATSSAIATANAINATYTTHGVRATANSTIQTMTGGTYSGTLAGSALQINGVAITGTITSVTDLETLINAEQFTTGVTATVSGADIILTASDGRNIQIQTDASHSDDIWTNFTLDATAKNQMKRATVTLRDHESITLGGRMTSSQTMTGFTYGTTAASANTGTTAISNIYLAQQQPDNRDRTENYKIVFLSSSTYQIFTESEPTTALSGFQINGSLAQENLVAGTGSAIYDYTDGDTIEVEGVSFTLTGAPATDDILTIDLEPVVQRDIFQAIEDFISSLQTISTANDPGRFDAATGIFINNLINAETRILEARSDLGSRLNSVESQQKSNEQFFLFAERGISQIEDLDFISAVSDLLQQSQTLEASQRSFVKISELSLFNFIRI